MAAFLPSVNAPKRAVAAFGEEIAPILRLNMAAGHAQATWKKHATRKPVKVRTLLSNLSFYLSFCMYVLVVVLVCFKIVLFGLANIVIARLVGCVGEPFVYPFSPIHDS